jgi:hypothetical protein
LSSRSSATLKRSNDKRVRSRLADRHHSALGESLEPEREGTSSRG